MLECCTGLLYLALALASMLADGIAIYKDATRKEALLHVLQPASAMPVFLLPSDRYGKRDVTIGSLPAKLG